MTEQLPREDFAPIVATLRDGRRFTLRSIRPDDKGELQEAFERLSWEARYTRFMAPMNELSRAMLERILHPVPGRELALVAIAGEGSDEDIVGSALYVADAGNETCEFAIVVADDWHGVGLASRLMRELIQGARAHGLKRIEGFVLAGNTPMLNLARRLGFQVASSEEGPTVKLVRLDLESD